MIDFIKTQYKIHCSGGKSIGINRIKKLAKIFMTENEQAELFTNGTKASP